MDKIPSSKKFTFSAPSKTFLLGEYGVLFQGCALLINTIPRFYGYPYHAFSKKNPTEFHPQSATGLYLKEQKAKGIFKHPFIFQDPHQGKGGCGASSAAFLIAIAHQNQACPANNPKSVFSQVKAYQNNYCANFIIKPSGADIISQLLGNITWVNYIKQELTTLSWPFQHLKAFVARTSIKILTHEHLSNCSKVIEGVKSDLLNQITIRAWHHLKQLQAHEFCQTINDFYQQLCQQNLVHHKTKQIIQALYRSPLILAAKGCGALGADTLLILGESKKSAKIISLIKNQGLELIATSDQLSSGLKQEIYPIYHA